MTDYLAILDAFHFIRPQWLGIIPLCLLFAYLRQKQYSRHPWIHAIAADKLPWLLLDKHHPQRTITLYLLSAWLIASIALAGPSWNKQSHPLSKQTDALVILLDLSPSMLATDLKPNRLVRAKLKLTDLLRNRKEGQTALVAYAGDAHIVSPLTTDAKTILDLLQALHPNMMPSRGSQTEEAVKLGIQLLNAGAIRDGHLLLVTDEVTTNAQQFIKQQLQKNNPRHQRLSILGVGTTAGAPIPDNQGSFVKDNNHRVILAQLNRNQLEILAAQNGGRYVDIQVDHSDIDYLLNDTVRQIYNQAQAQANPQLNLDSPYNDWQDRGGWLVLLLLPMALLLFRRNWLLMLLLLPSIYVTTINTAYAQQATLKDSPQNSISLSWWDKLWLNKQQQGETLLQLQAPRQAAQILTDPRWQAYANLQQHEFAKAAEKYAHIDTASAWINSAKAEVMNKNLPVAIEALQQAEQKAKQNNDDALVKQVQEYRQLLEWMQQQKQNDSQEKQNSAENKHPEQRERNLENKQNTDQQKQNSSADKSSKQEQQYDKQNKQSQNKRDAAQHEHSNNKQEKQPTDQPSATTSTAHGQQQNQSEQQSSHESHIDQQTIDQINNKQDSDTQKLENKKAGLKQNKLDNTSTDEQDTHQSLPLDKESIQTLRRQRWLDTIVDDPSGLLRRKFHYQSQQRQRQNPAPISEQRY